MTLFGTIRRTAKTARNALAVTMPCPEETDILDTLRKEHEETAELLEMIVGSDKARERRALLARLRKVLAPHLAAEENIVYRAVLTVNDGKTKLDGNEGRLEHDIVLRTFVKLTKIRNAASPEFSATAKVLKELVAHHVEEEERNIWADVCENFSEEDRFAMNRAFEAAKKKVGRPEKGT